MTPVCVGPSAAPAGISGNITDDAGNPVGGVVMSLSGAASATTITDSNGNYHFDNVETDNFYTVTPALANYTFAPESRAFSLLGNRTDAIFTATAAPVITANAIDASGFFVRQQYLDFLGREPDGGGFQYWTNELAQCAETAPASAPAASMFRRHSLPNVSFRKAVRLLCAFTRVPWEGNRAMASLPPTGNKWSQAKPRGQ